MKKQITKNSRIIQLRKKGLTIPEIARRLGKSIYYVYSRINPQYSPKKIKKRRTKK